MTDDTNGPKPWDIEQFRGVRKHAQRKQDWEMDRELVLDASYRTERLTGKVTPKFDTEGPSLFWLSLKTACLTVLTLGLYRFWMITRLRRHYWNAIRIQGDPLEYTGTGLEKILGFLVAIIILAVYLGLINVVLTFIGMSYFDGNPFALQLSILAAVPLFFFAAYRARRYIMARTRWRGIRFGMDNGAWGYSVRALWYWFLTLITGGLLYPYKQFKLAKYMADRTWFGDLKFCQNGSWAGLFAYWIWLYIVLGLAALAAWGLAADPGNPATTVIAGLIITVGYISFLVMFMRYEVVAFRYIWSNRALGEASFQNDVTPGKIISVYLVGTLLVAICTTLISLVVLLVAGVASAFVLGIENMSQVAELDATLADKMADPVQSIPAAVVVLALVYIVLFAVPFAFSQIFITRPILQRKAEAMVIHDAQALTRSRQREHDHAAEAGGFADALGVDVGAGI
ncbi:MAG: YjgN family protein [Paracoccaceae bacterium]